MPTSVDDPLVKHGQKFSGIVVKLPSDDSPVYVVRFYGNLKGLLRVDDVQQHGDQYAIKEGALIDVYLLHATERGLTLTMSQEESEKSATEKAIQTKSLKHTLKKENKSLLKEIRKANENVMDDGLLGKQFSVMTVSQGKNGFHVKPLDSGM